MTAESFANIDIFTGNTQAHRGFEPSEVCSGFASFLPPTMHLNVPDFGALSGNGSAPMHRPPAAGRTF
jgi:hypothetical protein